MSKILYWAIDPNQKPSTAELRDAILTGGQNNQMRRETYGRYPEKVGAVGVVPIKGSLYTSDYIRTSASVEMFNNDPEVTAILLDIDSPGGLVAGSMECASIIRDSEKPVYAYIEGMGCSAAYLLASAAKKVMASPASEVGSVGVQASWTNYDGLLGKLGIQKVYFRSKYAEKKNLLPSTKEGEAAIQKTIDGLWDLFAASIAAGRGVDVEDIIAKFGHGEVFLGQEALDHGMVDEIVQNFDACMASMDTTTPGGEGEDFMDIQTVEQLTAQFPDLTAQAVQAGVNSAVDATVKTERDRVAALLDLREHTEDFSVIADAIKSGQDVSTTMANILKANTDAKKKQEEEATSVLEAAEKASAKAVVQQVPLTGETVDTEDDAERARIEEINTNLEGKK